MKNPFKHALWMPLARRAWAISLFALINTTCANAATVSGGSLILNIDKDALSAGVVLDNYPDTPTDTFPICCRPSIYIEEFYDASAASKTFAQLRDENTPDLYDGVSDAISGLGLEFKVNGATIAPNPTGRQNRSTTFSFDPGNLAASASGRIGLGGAIRFRVDVTPPNNRVILGDMTLIYDPANENLSPGQSSWTLMNYIGFPAGAFNLFDVTTLVTADTLTLSGVLGLGGGFDHLGGIGDTRVGTFTFQTAIVPIPAAIWLFGSGLAGMAFSAVRKRNSQL